MEKKGQTTKTSVKRQRLLAVTGVRKDLQRPAGHSLRGMDQKTVDILVDDKIATGG